MDSQRWFRHGNWRLLAAHTCAFFGWQGDTAKDLHIQSSTVFILTLHRPSHRTETELECLTKAGCLLTRIITARRSSDFSIARLKKVSVRCTPSTGAILYQFRF